MLLLLRKLKTLTISLLLIHILTMAVITCTKFGFPYDGSVKNPALQRYYILHSERTFYDAKGSVRKTDSGIFVQALDRNSLNYMMESFPELKKARTVFEDCKKELFCGFPVFTSRFIKPAPYSYWIQADPPTIHHPSTIEVLNQTQVSLHIRRIRLSVSGPDHITIGLSPQKHVKLIKWSFDDNEPPESEPWNDRKTYMVYYSHGVMGGTMEFDIDLEITQNYSGSLLDVAVVGHYMHDKKFNTKEFKEFLSSFPDWAHLTPWVTTYKSWII